MSCILSRDFNRYFVPILSKKLDLTGTFLSNINLYDADIRKAISAMIEYAQYFLYMFTPFDNNLSLYVTVEDVKIEDNYFFYNCFCFCFNNVIDYIKVVSLTKRFGGEFWAWHTISTVLIDVMLQVMYRKFGYCFVGVVPK